MTRYPSASALAAVLTLLFAASGQADDPPTEDPNVAEAEEVGERPEDVTVRGSESRARELFALSGAPAQSYRPAGMRIELFGRGALSLLNITAEDTIGISGGPESVGESISAKRLASELSWGMGARLMQGPWGIEATYDKFDSFLLSPSWLVTDDVGGGDGPSLLGEAFAVSQANLLVGQVIRTFPVADGRVEVSLGVGAGWLRVADSATDRLLSGAFQIALPVGQEIDFEIPPSFVPEVEVTADRTSVVYAGSLGLAFRLGRIFLRPRADVIVSRALTTEMSIGFPGFDELMGQDVGGFDIRYDTSVKPTIFLISLDIGLSN